MPRSPRKPSAPDAPHAAPRSYQDIVRATVPNPDGSYRPTSWSVEAAHHRNQPVEGQTADDARIREAIYERLAVEPALEGSGLWVDVREGVVDLRGSVSRAADRAIAEALVRSIEGVNDVHNESVVREEPTAGDAARR